MVFWFANAIGQKSWNLTWLALQHARFGALEDRCRMCVGSSVDQRRQPTIRVLPTCLFSESTTTRRKSYLFVHGCLQWRWRNAHFPMGAVFIPALFFEIYFNFAFIVFSAHQLFTILSPWRFYDYVGNADVHRFNRVRSLDFHVPHSSVAFTSKLMFISIHFVLILPLSIKRSG